MKALPKTTKHRLQKIPQDSSIWEGDRLSLGQMASRIDSDVSEDAECIIWIDGSEGSVRAMDIVSPDGGLEVIVRTLLRAIESPHPPCIPTRPQKIVVKDREIQFFLRGVLQGLDITVEYARELPLIDQLFQSFQEMGRSHPPALPSKYDTKLQEIAYQIWEQEPWDLLADSDILKVEIDGLISDPIYICVMGMMSAEYGVLLYRSLDSLKEFRKTALDRKSVEQLEKAFLAQDCWFLNYEELDTEEIELEDWDTEPEIDVMPFFGSLHPLEGMRAFIDEEEANIIHLTLEGIFRFCEQYETELEEDDIPKISQSYKISSVTTTEKAESILVKVSTLPDLTAELLAFDDDFDSDDSEPELMIEEDLVPEGSLVTLGSISWELAQSLKKKSGTYYQTLDINHKIKNLPAILIQTSRPKAKTLIEAIKSLGGVKTVCFNPGSDPFSGDTYDLGMLQTGDGKLHIFAEYSRSIIRHTQALERWNESCAKAKGYCSLVITMGVTGASRGNPQPKDMLGVFEVKAVSGSDLGMGVLQLMPSFDFE
ncbi:MAG: hypothetical protein QNJ60_04150 [Xenococcaceae cyanobacterium MO_188.B19]|nr:hypothetical protein [Xenococcaceae cyanobacterium MO_188.B19]